MSKILVLECKKCKKFIWSRDTHDFRRCKCGACAIDGGRDYTRISGEEKDFKRHQIEIPSDISKMSFVNLGLDAMKINKKNQWPIPQWAHSGIIIEKIAHLHSEVSEALKAYRDEDIFSFMEEIADTIIRSLDLGVVYNPKNFTEAFETLILELYTKIQINLLRGFKHGRKKF